MLLSTQAFAAAERVAFADASFGALALRDNVFPWHPCHDGGPPCPPPEQRKTTFRKTADRQLQTSGPLFSARWFFVHHQPNLSKIDLKFEHNVEVHVDTTR
jgi:hypothetical protein